MNGRTDPLRSQDLVSILLVVSLKDLSAAMTSFLQLWPEPGGKNKTQGSAKHLRDKLDDDENRNTTTSGMVCLEVMRNVSDYGWVVT